jgi:spore maturation protein CgeB
MVAAGYSPSVRLFEAAGCGSAIVSDEWPGLESFFLPKQEMLLAHSSADVIDVLTSISPEEARKIGRSAQERVLAEHTAEQRALEFEAAVATKSASLHAQTF